MSNTRLLIAVNNLVQHYESMTTKSISLENETNLDVLQYSNLQKMEIMLSAVEIGNNLNVNSSVKENVSKNDPVLNQKESYLTANKNFYEECVTKIEPELAVKEIQETLDVNVQKPVSSAIEKNVYKKTRKYTEKANEWLNEKTIDLFDNYEDVLDCINCRKPEDFKNPIPPYETAWEFRQFLNSLKQLLEDIKISLDSTKLSSDICNFLAVFENKGYLCLSSYPLIAASMPIIINDAKFKLMEIGVSWTGLVGGIISPVLNTITHIVEYFGGLASPILECLINTIRSTRLALESAYKVTIAKVREAELIPDAIGSAVKGATNLFDKKQIKEQVVKSNRVKKKTNQIKKAVNLKAEREAYASDRNNRKPANVSAEKAKSKTKKTEAGLGFRIKGKEDAFRSSAFIASNSPLTKKRKSEGFENFLKKMHFFEMQLESAKNIMNNALNKVVYALKSFDRYFVEPAFVSSKLIGEIKVAFNTIRLINLI